jgi:hypothetical protein
MAAKGKNEVVFRIAAHGDSFDRVLHRKVPKTGLEIAYFLTKNNIKPKITMGISAKKI